MELRRYALLLRRWLWLVILLPGLAAGTVFVINSLTTPVYQVSATLLINQAPNATNAPDYNSMLLSERLGKTYRELLKKRPLLTKVIETLKLNVTEEQLARRINVNIIRDTLLMVLLVEDTNPQQAALIANTLAREFNLQNQELQSGRYLATKQSIQEELDRLQKDITTTQASLESLKTAARSDQAAEETRLQTSLTQYRNSYATLLKSFEDVRLAEAQATSSLSVVEEASTANRIRPTILTSTILAGIIALLLAVGLVLLIEYLDDSVKSTEQIEHLTGATTLGLIARIKGSDLPDRLITCTNSNSPTTEAYRVLRANIEFSEVDSPIRTIMVTSSDSGEGKSLTVANLAVAIAQSGKRVIAVDTDLRRPSLHHYFGLSNVRGVTTALLEQNSFVTDYLVQTEVANLQILASGALPPNPAELIGSKRMVELVEELKTLCDVVLFDSSPVLPVVDPTLLARSCDAALITVSYRKTRSGALKKAYNQLQQSGIRMLGTVLNRVPSENTSYYYYPDNATTRPVKGKSKGKRSPEPVAKKAVKVSTAARTIRPAAPVRNEVAPPELSSREPGETALALKKSDFSALIVDFQAEDASIPPAVEAPITTQNHKVMGMLEVIAGPSTGIRFDITTARTRVGRVPIFSPLSSQPISDPLTSQAYSVPNQQTMYLVNYEMLQVDDEKVSREHIEIIDTPDGTFLRDLRSLNGTWHNGQKLKDQPVRLQDQDEIRLGYRTILTYHRSRG
ncbi:MAG: Non-specific protein-tyrosine kinase [Chloroflexi bacterium]|nr:Non-specific protein-tyrosine kinase [Chloroflexota bacterium]